MKNKVHTSTAATLTRPETSHIVEWLSRPDAYSVRPGRVKTIETHISWVFLTDCEAYKLKKPVRFDFLDFSTPKARRAACQEEVRLNRRLAPDVYLGVVPITIDNQGHLELDGPGTPCDWLVKMRRLDTDRTLERLVQTHRLTDHQLDELATMLADFYSEATPLLIRAAEYLREIETHVRANRNELLNALHHLPTSLVGRVHSAQLRFLRLHPNLLSDRVCDGRIIEGHGDLRPEHICFADRPIVFDCIEFSPELRTVDVADELSFLAMECDYLGAGEVGSRVFEAYSRQSGDQPDHSLIAFFKTYRACVRAKVLALRAAQLDEPKRGNCLKKAEEYLWLADRSAASLGPPLVFIVGGLMGTGKSTLAQALADDIGAELLQTDAVRRELFGRSRKPAAFGEGHYRNVDRRRVYDEMFRRARSALSNGQSLVLDGTFLSARLQHKAVALARRRGAEAVVVHCHCPADVARRRIAHRAKAGRCLSEGRPELYDLHRRTEEPKLADTVTAYIDTTMPLVAQIESVYDLARDRQILARTA